MFDLFDDERIYNSMMREHEKKGREEAFLSSIKSLMKSMSMTAEQAMAALEVPEPERTALLAMI